MKCSTLAALCASATILPAMAWPGMQKLQNDLNREVSRRELEKRGIIRREIGRRQEADEGDEAGEVEDGEDPFDSNELIGDLLTIGGVTAVAQQIASIIISIGVPFSNETWTTPVPAIDTPECAADTCCVWDYIAKELAAAYAGTSGRCNSLARGAVRMGFHDAASWNKNATHGGADGSLILAGEMTRTENFGMEEIVNYTQTVFDKYKSYGIGMADLIQMSATVGTVVCPLGPRIRSYVGRIDSSKPAPEGLLPDVNSDAQTLLDLFADKTIRTHGLSALVGAHTTSQQQFVDPSRAFDPQDSTPGVWDVNFYNETVLPDADVPSRVFRFPSDVALSQHPDVKPEWNKFILDQADWNEDFAREYIRLSLLGVNNINNLTECSKVLPAAVTVFNPPDLKIVSQWTKGKYDNMGPLVAEADTITTQTLEENDIPPS